MKSLTELRTSLNKKVTEHLLACSKISEEKQQLATSERLAQATLDAQDYLQQVAEKVQKKTQYQIAKVVSKCLSAVFAEPYTLKIEFDRKRGKTEAKFVYYRDGNKINPRVTSGGVLQVAALALRLASLILSMPPARRFLVLDEPFLALSKENLGKIAQLIQTLSDELSVQLVICTHSDQLQVGKVIQIGKPSN